MNRIVLCAALAAVLGTGLGAAHAESFTYHGTLQDAGKPADGPYDLRLTLYSSANGGAALSTPVQLFGVPVREGSFSTTADFGDLSSLGTQAWLEVAVKPAGSGEFAALASRSPVSPDVNSCPGAWSLDGNSGNPAPSYLGTADAQDVIIKAGGITVASLVASKTAVGMSGGPAYAASGLKSTALSWSYAALGVASLAGGYSGGTLFDGSFVWGDKPSSGHTINDSAPNQFIVQANGGVGINTAHAEGGTNPLNSTLTIGLPSMTTGSGLASIKLKGQDSGTTSVTLGGLASLLGTGYPVLAITSHNNDGTNYTNAVFSNKKARFNGSTAIGALSVGTDGTDGNGAYVTNGGTWTNASSRTFKDGFAAVNVEGVLNKLVAMPVQTWFYKQSHAEGVHMGPVAEDFATSFGLGNDDKHVGTVDESGVAFAAIQGLNKKLEKENAELRGKFDDLATRLARLESGKGE